jgi:hypothetical protein
MNTMKSRNDLEEYHYNNELKQWLNMHATRVAKKYAEQDENRDHYHKLIHSLRKDKNPHDTASIILGLNLPEESISSPCDEKEEIAKVVEEVKVCVADEETVGLKAKKLLRQELHKNPHNECLSPSVILTQRRRKEILQKIQNAEDVGHYKVRYPTSAPGSPLPTTTITASSSSSRTPTSMFSPKTPASVSSSASSLPPIESSPQHTQQPSAYTTTSCTSPTPLLVIDKKQSTFNHTRQFDSLHQELIGKKPAMFSPKWEDYDTMRTRWSYIQPQTKHLREFPEIYTMTPTTSTNMITIHGNTIQGKFIEVDHHVNQSLYSNAATAGLGFGRSRESPNKKKRSPLKGTLQHGSSSSSNLR